MPVGRQDVGQTRASRGRLIGHEGAAYLAAYLLVLVVAAAIDLALINDFRLERFSAVLLEAAPMLWAPSPPPPT